MRDAARSSSSDQAAHIVGNDVEPRNVPGTSQEGVEGDSDVTNREDMDDEPDLSWSTVLKRSFEGFLRGERPNAYGEWLEWGD